MRREETPWSPTNLVVVILATVLLILMGCIILGAIGAIEVIGIHGFLWP